jgi:phage gp45-like
MHRATQLNIAFRSFTAGGARSVVHQADDSKLMQEMGGSFMSGESRQRIESPQNYGFTSVVMDADQGGKKGAETFISFMGGGRSIPVAGPMDDRRHRLQKLEKGDVAMFRTKSDQQQFHLTQDGGYWSAPDNKTVRMQLVKQQQQGGSSGGSGSGGGGSARDTSGGSGGQSGAGGAGGQNGQQSVYKDGNNSVQFVDVTKDKTRLSGNEAHLMLSDGDSYVHCISQKTYLGGRQDKHQFALVETTQGPAYNVYARVGGKAGDADDLVIAEPRGAPSPATALAVVLALLLGVSLGVNYSVLSTSAWQIASR